MRCYAFVLAYMYRYAWLIIFEIFRIFFFLDRGVGGWGVSYPNFFWIFIFFLYLQGPLRNNLAVHISTALVFRNIVLLNLV